MQTHTQKKRLSAIMAVIAIIALLVAGTYAWRDYTQHKTNEFDNNENNKYHDVRLIEKFDGFKHNWTTVDDPVTKEIRVSNLGSAPEYGNVYVRIQLKEFMEKAEIKYTETNVRYALKSNGHFMIITGFDDTQETEALAELVGTEYEGYGITYLKDVVTGEEGWFVKSGDNQINGQYGKFVTTEVKIEGTSSLVSGVTKANTEASLNHQLDSNGECLYTPHDWKNSTVFETYVQWLLGDDVISYTDWQASGGGLTNKWVYDDTTDDGYVYWMNPLAPGQTTSNLLDKVKLILQPDGNFYYAIHADMEATSLDELAKSNREWSDAPNSVIEAFIGKALPTTEAATEEDTTVEETTEATP